MDTSSHIPVVSIIMPAYNAQKHIAESIRSICRQTYTDWELIVIDDCSGDNTYRIVQQLARDEERIVLMRTDINSGSGIARNMGIHVARGRFIAFCDSDDRWYDTKLAVQLPFMLNKGYEFTTTYYEDVDEDYTPFYVVKPADGQTLQDVILGCTVGTSEVIYDTQRIGKVFMPDFRRSQDWALWLRLLKKVPALHVCPQILSQYMHNQKGVSRKKTAMVKAAINVYHVELGYSYTKSWMIFLFRFLPRNIFKKLRKLKDNH